MLNQAPWTIGSYNFPDSPAVLSNPQWTNCLIDLSMGMGSMTLHFDWLCFSVRVTNCCKKKLPWCRIKNTLSCMHEDICNVVRDYAGWVKWQLWVFLQDPWLHEPSGGTHALAVTNSSLIRLKRDSVPDTGNTDNCPGLEKLKGYTFKDQCFCVRCHV